MHTGFNPKTGEVIGKTAMRQDSGFNCYSPLVADPSAARYAINEI
jgi:hypothetical protein